MMARHAVSKRIANGPKQTAERLSFFLLGLLLLLGSGCTAFPRRAALQEDAPDPAVYSLEKAIAALDRRSGGPEARAVARVALARSHELTQTYRLVSPPLFHNVLVNMQLRSRGLCHHFAEDLLTSLQTLHLRHYRLYWGVAHQGSLFREHHSIIITARGKTPEQGLVLDAWRNSGKLYWSAVTQDHYPWQSYPVAQNALSR